jgi:hypothetical protein
MLIPWPPDQPQAVAIVDAGLPDVQLDAARDAEADGRSPDSGERDAGDVVPGPDASRAPDARPLPPPRGK